MNMIIIDEETFNGWRKFYDNTIVANNCSSTWLTNTPIYTPTFISWNMDITTHNLVVDAIQRVVDTTLSKSEMDVYLDILNKFGNGKCKN
jgi:hypothetical protein